MAMADKLKHEERHFIAVIGDAAIVGGMAMEGLNHAGASEADLLIILNDNGIAIDKSAGAFSNYLSRAGKASANHFFEAFNLKYFGPIDGNDVLTVVDQLRKIKEISGPKLVHAITVKGKGMRLAEKFQTQYHSPGLFDKETGEILPPYPGAQPPKYQHVFGSTLVELAELNERIVGITPAMPTGSSLNIMMEKMPHRAFDVGIAEEHAVTFAAGLAAEGMIPFCNIYSSFMQRAYDQVIHDVALQKLHVIFCLDRAGLVGEDGATHHGAFDLAYFRAIPDMIICAPMNEEELRNMMFTAQAEENGTFVIRYPRSRGVMIDWKRPFTKMEIGKGRMLRRGENVALISIGHVGNNVTKAAEHLMTSGIRISQYDMRFLKPIDENLLDEIFKNHTTIITVEDGTINGGLGSAVLEFMADHGYNTRVVRLGIPDRFIEQGTIEELQGECGFDVDSIKDAVKRLIK
jgi:1-deoxy-D-xylulose-5-phosphate synthase